MSVKIIADSGCDSSPEVREQLDLELIPLSVLVPGHPEIKDDLDVDTKHVLDIMNAAKEPTRSACPSVDDYAKRMIAYDECVVITLSQLISGSYNCARVARDMVLSIYPDKKIHIFDSMSASVGELLVAYFIDGLKQLGDTFETIIEKTENFINNGHLKTMLVLEDLSTLVKNGRLSRVKGIVSSVLSIHPILADNGKGEIEALYTVRGLNQAFAKLVNTVHEFTCNTIPRSVRLILSHCHAPERAQQVKKAILDTCQAIKEVIIVPTGGISTMYANKGGIVVTFQYKGF